MNKQQKIDTFDPSQPGLANQNIFGLPFTETESNIIIIPVPWEVTVSYGAGASQGPESILKASFQVDLCHQEFPELWKLGIYLDINEQTKSWEEQSCHYKRSAQMIIEALEEGKVISEDLVLKKNQDQINTVCIDLKEQIKARVQYWMQQGKKVVLLGGDHSTPLGYYEALATQYDHFGILHLDAHMDLRCEYEGFIYSHASIMYNALKIPQITKIVQVGIRDFCEQEVQTVFSEGCRVSVFTDTDLKTQQFQGMTWQQQCEVIIDVLPDHVCISFDVDGMYSWYCPNTGTPVPGGVSFEQATYLLSALIKRGKKVIGFDLVEVAPGEEGNDWDGNVGARLLFHLCGILAKSNGLETGEPILF